MVTQTYTKAFLKICNAIQAFTHASDLPKFVRSLRANLQEAGLNFQILTFSRLLDPTTALFDNHTILLDGTSNRTLLKRPYLWEVWKSGKYTYRPDILKPIYSADLPPNFIETTKRDWGIATPCIINLPHSKGVLTLRSSHPYAFDDANLRFLEQIVAVLSIGISRMEDMEHVERTRIQFETLVNSIDGIIWEIDTNTFQHTFVSAKAEQVLGYPTKQWEKDPAFWTSHIHPDDRDRAIEAYRRATLENQNAAIEYRMIHAEGHTIWFHTVISVVKKANSPTRLQGVMIDITERKKISLALARSEEKFRKIFTQSQDAIILVDPEQNVILDGNPRACEMLIYPYNELVGRNMVSLEASPNHSLHQFIDQLSQEGVGLTDQITLETRMGDPIPVEMSASFIDYSNGSALIFMIRDMTSRKKIEANMVRIQRLNAIGELSAGISHNLNNILVGVIGPAQMLQQMTQDEEILTETQNILDAGLQARDLVRRLHLSIRGEDEMPSPIDLSAVINDAVNISRPRWKDQSEVAGIHIELIKNLGHMSHVYATHSGLMDVIVNLIFNAVDALPEGGQITITTRQENKWVCLEVEDTGIGMPENIKNRVFEPLFTTKANVGTGLGLSTAYKQIDTWGGEISVESEPDKGTIFNISLPATEVL